MGAVKNSKALIDMRNDNASMVGLRQETFVTLAEVRHGLITLNSNDFVVYSQKHKVWVLVFLVRMS